ncbi:MAG: M23 family metallopeptidase [Brevundimonas sp.]|nr:MAG: M23 family metallopeptidase [Brevundimonas sp.]
MRMATGLRALAVLGAMGLLAACATEPRYSIYADAAPQPNAYSPPAPTYGPTPSGEGVRGPTNPANESPPPTAAPTVEIEGGALDLPALSGGSTYSSTPAYAGSAAAGPVSDGFTSPPPPARGAAVAGAAYVIQTGDTISGIGRRFRTPVQTLIDLNNLGPRAAIQPGQQLILPSGAVDVGGDPYATGPSPIGVVVPTGTPPPPPPPPSGNAAVPREPAAVALAWPVQGEILRRFGRVGMGEKNNGVNIGASAGEIVRASAGGDVGYVGDDLANQGLTVLIVHPGGWRTVYGHLGSTTVRDGDRVREGQQIGTVGTTAGDGRPSIHYETWQMRGDEPVAVDPLTVLPR